MTRCFLPNFCCSSGTILADGKVDDKEMATFRRICHEAFGIGEDSIDGVIEFLNDFGYETSGIQAVDLFRELDMERRKLLARNMAAIAKADTQLAEQEIRLLKRTLEILEVDPNDLVQPKT